MINNKRRKLALARRGLKYKLYSLDNRNVKKNNKNIFITCFPKSASTYLAKLLSEITGYRLADVMQFAQQNEQDIYEYKLKEMVKNDSITQQHARGTDNNIAMMLKYNIKPVVLVRNIFDSLISYYDHLENEDWRVSMGYVHKNYFSFSREEKLKFLIKIHLPWYFNFLVSWQEAEKDINILWLSYEELFSNQVKSVQKILNFYRIKKTDLEISKIIPQINKKKTRFNKGISGRGQQISAELRKEIISLARVWEGDKDGERFKIIGI